MKPKKAPAKKTRSVQDRAQDLTGKGKVSGFRGNPMMRANKLLTPKPHPGYKTPYPNKPGTKRRGRKAKPIDWAYVEEMIKVGATMEEIGAVVGLDQVALTLRPEFLNCYKKAYSEGNISLRRMQMMQALHGHPTMLIWLGKNRLGQADKQIHEVSGRDGEPIQIQAQDLSRLTPQELEQLVEILRKIEAGQG